ncbi:MAG: fumarate hydratase [Candidatus Omnitrophica bacterium]|nr:fumarate hydratase [Candidatus Omnitrophota bacterium]MBU1869137.1 fumarate hydratase [Candidatus Omnitrophota bacterium]
MKVISANKIRDTVAKLCVEANLVLREDILRQLKLAYAKEKNKRAKSILEAIIKNAAIAKKEKLAICQDTGMPIVFLEIGQGVTIFGDLKSAVNKGIELGYKRASLRNSVVLDPLTRKASGYSPAVIHTEVVKGNSLKITVLPKGFGCENKSQLKMFKPTAEFSQIKRFIIDAVKQAGPDACPPYFVGVGIGGTADYACLLAKKALLKMIKDKKSKLEKELLTEINKLNIGPMGLGGRTTALAVHVETHPTHIAGLPVAVNISCHASRSATKII